MGSRSGMTSAIIASENASSMTKPVRRMRFASSGLPSPMRIPISGDAPHDIHTAAEPTMVTTGPQTPTPASAVSPAPAMWPMYILSTMLYSTLTNCASMLGSAVRQTSAPTSSRPRSFSLFIYPVSFFIRCGRRSTRPQASSFSNSRMKPSGFFLDFYYIFFPRKHQPRGPAFPFRAVFLNCFSHVA